LVNKAHNGLKYMRRGRGRRIRIIRRIRIRKGVTKYDNFSTFCSLKEMINKHVSYGKLCLTDAFSLFITTLNKSSQGEKINVLRER